MDCPWHSGHLIYIMKMIVFAFWTTPAAAGALHRRYCRGVRIAERDCNCVYRSLGNRVQTDRCMFLPGRLRFSFLAAKPANVRVAVGTAIADRPPRRSVRAELPHTALASDGWRQDGREETSHAVWRTPLNPMGRVWPRSVSGTRQVQRRSPWPPPFPPPPPPGLLSPLFGSFIGTMAESDSSRACISGLWLAAFPDRSAAEAVDTREVSRFSCISFPDVRGVSDYAGPAASSRIALDGSVAFPRTDTVGTRNEIYEAQYPAHQCPCLCFECVLAATSARLGVKMESLLPSRGALSSPTICRFIPALPSPGFPS